MLSLLHAVFVLHLANSSPEIGRDQSWNLKRNLKARPSKFVKAPRNMFLEFEMTGMKCSFATNSKKTQTRRAMSSLKATTDQNWSYTCWYQYHQPNDDCSQILHFAYISDDFRFTLFAIHSLADLSLPSRYPWWDHQWIGSNYVPTSKHAVAEIPFSCSSRHPDREKFNGGDLWSCIPS